ncbi:MAG: hypothetical protein JWM59_4661 [Verrucomicrobiales bacterium]|nr:hypothetical protein [Verrucomicrobiales bacterium]
MAALSCVVLPQPSALAQPATLENGATMEVLGTETGSLIGGDLTDPENDGDEVAGPEDPSWNWKSITSNNEPGFEGGEFSYNVFDNQLAGGNGKWCCDDATEEAPKNITVEFFEPVRLTHFTVSSANDSPDRDPLTWQIQGSNDGETFEPIFVHDSDESQWGDVRHQVNKYTLTNPAKPYTFIRFECTRTSGTLYQVGEIEYFGEFGLGVPKIELIGTGTAALIGSDLTDPDNNGDEVAGPTDLSWNWESITSNNKPGFDGAELAFNIFDNRVGGGTDKWCCDDPTPAAPHRVDVKFRSPVVLKYFTITSGNDARDREPTTWQIAGSNDGVTYTPIFVQDAPTSIWTATDQVAKITLPVPAPPYLYLRYEVSVTPGPLHQLAEIEYFGDIGGQGKPILSKRKAGRSTLTLDVTDGSDTSVNAATMVLKIDDAVVTPAVQKVLKVTTYTYTFPARPEPDSTHTYELAGADNFGNALKFTGEFKIPVPWFPEADLATAEPKPGLWSTRYIFDAGVLDSIPSVLAQIAAVGTPDFTGQYVDVTSDVLNHGNGGIFGDPLPYAQEAVDLGCCTDDFVMLSVAYLNITEEDDYTFGVHSDDGFAMRIRGGTAVSASGNGQLDPGDPEAVVHPANTGDSNTRGVYHLKAGTYRMEFFWWERAGGDHGELYVAKGAFVNDADALFLLVGQTIPSGSYAKLGVDASGWSVVSSDPGGDQLTAWDTGLADLEATAGPASNYDVLNVGDPDTNGGVLPFPKNAAGDQDDFAMKATAKLVVPKAGTYQIGFNSDDGAYMKIAGQTFTEITVNATGASIIADPPDQVICDALTGASNTVALITLAAGTYDMEVGMFERGGGAFLSASGVEAGSPVQPLLAKNGAGTLDVPAMGLALGTPPGGGTTPTDTISSITISGANLVIGFKPSDPNGNYRLARSANLQTWTVLADAPVVTAGVVTFTIPRGTDPRSYYRVVK